MSSCDELAVCQLKNKFCVRSVKRESIYFQNIQNKSYMMGTTNRKANNRYHILFLV